MSHFSLFYKIIGARQSMGGVIKGRSSDMPNAKGGTTGTLIKKLELNLNGVGLFNGQ
jgi:hypothetical protein